MKIEKLKIGHHMYLFPEEADGFEEVVFNVLSGEITEHYIRLRRFNRDVITCQNMTDEKRTMLKLKYPHVVFMNDAIVRSYIAGCVKK